MSTAFELPVNRTTIDWAVKYNDDRAKSYAVHAINQHDKLVEALRWIATEEFDCMPGDAVQELLRDYIHGVLASEDTP